MNLDNQVNPLRSKPEVDLGSLAFDAHSSREGMGLPVAIGYGRGKVGAECMH